MLIREMKLGDSASVTKTVTETDVYLFAGITGDLNPAHTNEPVYIGDTVTATCTVRELFPEKNIVKLDTVCTNQHGDVVIKGVATAMPPKEA